MWARNKKTKEPRVDNKTQQPRADNKTQERCLVSVLTWGWILLSWASMWARNKKTKKPRVDNKTQQRRILLSWASMWADNKTQELCLVSVLTWGWANNKTQEPSRRGSNRRMITEMSAGNLAMMIRRKTHFPHSDLCKSDANRKLCSNKCCEGLGQDFAVFNQQADIGDVH
ncbi:uncharacterized protein RBU57_016765 [Macrochelys suwanniensis]